MELKGKIIKILPEQSGEGRNGTWKKQEYVIELPGQYPKQVCFYAWGDTIESFALKEGEEVTVSIDIESREYNGKWYTNIKGWRVSRDAAAAPAPADTSAGDPANWPTAADEQSGSDAEDFDDLPF